MFPLIRISGEPFARGQQYGAQAAALIRRSIANYAHTFAYRRGLDWPAIQELALGYLPLLEATTPDLVAEMQGIAEGAGRRFAEILALNARTELLAGSAIGPAHAGYEAAQRHNQARGVPEYGECTTLAALPEACANGTTLLAQTWDWSGEQRASCVVLRIEAPGEPAVITVTEAGIMAKIGLNSAGVGVALNILRSMSDGLEPGMPVHVLLRAALQQPDLEAVLALAERVRPGASSCVTVASAAGQALSLELTPAGVAPVSPQQGLLAHTNHCLLPAAQAHEKPLDPLGSSIPRYNRALALLAAQHGRLDVAALQAALRDHDGAPLCICRHPDPQLPAIDRTESVLGAVLDLEARVLYLAPGLPCQVEFTRLAFDDN